MARTAAASPASQAYSVARLSAAPPLAVRGTSHSSSWSTSISSTSWGAPAGHSRAAASYTPSTRACP